MDVEHSWSLATSQLQVGLELRTWSLGRGYGPVFIIKEISRSAIIIAPKSTGNERSLVKGTFEKARDYLDTPGSGIRKKSFSTSYSLGILKHLELI